MSSEAKTTTDHKKIKQWIEERDGHPALVEGATDKSRAGGLMIDYPGYSGEETLQPITWEEFFERFEQNELAFLYREETEEGEKSRFSKLVSRDTRKKMAGLLVSDLRTLNVDTSFMERIRMGTQQSGKDEHAREDYAPAPLSNDVAGDFDEGKRNTRSDIDHSLSLEEGPAKEKVDEERDGGY